MQGIVSRWKWRSPSAADAAGGGTSGPLADRVLRGREIEDPVAFLDDGYGRVVPPEGLTGAVEAGQRLSEAIATGRRIVIHGDYDFDGIAASAILARSLRLLAADAEVRVVLPDRYQGGYGRALISPFK